MGTVIQGDFRPRCGAEPLSVAGTCCGACSDCDKVRAHLVTMARSIAQYIGGSDADVEQAIERVLAELDLTMTGQVQP